MLGVALPRGAAETSPSSLAFAVLLAPHICIFSPGWPAERFHAVCNPLHPRAQLHVLMSQNRVICLSPHRLEILFSIPYLPRNHFDPAMTALSDNITRMNSRHQSPVDRHLSGIREHYGAFRIAAWDAACSRMKTPHIYHLWNIGHPR